MCLILVINCNGSTTCLYSGIKPLLRFLFVWLSLSGLHTLYLLHIIMVTISTSCHANSQLEYFLAGKYTSLLPCQRLHEHEHQDSSNSSRRRSDERRHEPNENLRNMSGVWGWYCPTLQVWRLTNSFRHFLLLRGILNIQQPFRPSKLFVSNLWAISNYVLGSIKWILCKFHTSKGVQKEV